MTDTTTTGCPFGHGDSAESGPEQVHASHSNAGREWWPNKLDLRILAQNTQEQNPYGEAFDYAEAFAGVDYAGLKADIAEALTTSHEFWPADFGHYGPMVVRMAWHSAGTYRVTDGRGGSSRGQQRFAPLNSWPDNVLLDRARRILWPVKKKYGKSVSWADLMILSGNVAMETMGFTTFGFAGGRDDVWEADDATYWGAETQWLADDNRIHGGAERVLEAQLAATEMGLIYVNPEGPGGEPDPLKAAHDIRVTFARMAMDDEETVALIAGGHTFGKTHGAHAGDVKGPEPEAAPLEDQGLGWRTASGDDATGSGLEVTWTYHPTRWDNEFFHILFGYEWELMDSPAGAKQWRPKDGGGSDMVPLAHSDGRREPRMLTTDLALRFDPIYGPISAKFRDDQAAFADAYARAWFKLTHRDMGPSTRYLGPEVPSEELIWQDPVPAGKELSAEEIAAVKDAVRESGLSVSELVSTAWAAASSHRNSDRRGGLNGGRIRLEPQRSWEVNEPEKLAPVLTVLEGIAGQTGASFSDVLAIAGAVGVEAAATAAGVSVEVPVTTGRGDASQEQTDVNSFSYLEPRHDGFRNYLGDFAHSMPAEYYLVDKANLLGLTAPEMTVLVGGLRVLGANFQGSDQGVLTDRPGQLTNDFFANLLDLDNEWKPVDGDGYAANEFECYTHGTEEKRWTGSRIDLLFGSNSELRAIAEVYASDDAKVKFVNDFVAAWSKVMDNDRFDLHR